MHADLVRVVRRASEISGIDFRVTEGVRSPERQAELFRLGKSRKMNSRHLTGHAVDVVAIVNERGDTSWVFELYQEIANAFRAAALELQVPIVWGGDWKTLRDGPHFELDRKHYP